ncbi:DEAD/DEAH box helicase family protein [Alkalicoccus chagannorensis]|uniref:DEAD/DEAH box helicase family protein n=1 Tax=Alkalicoccus chagannorensis TaxID=427072 RepID=UPI0003FF8676|nr:DEAD/DEAH box helicase family protein [Alkalicoccus chagannorensis]
MTRIALIQDRFIDTLRHETEKADTIYIMVSFAMTSGVKMLLPALEEAAKKGADIKICTGDYLYVTQPDALALLLELEDHAELRLWESRGTSFHPKMYFFDDDGERTLYVGSSNLSRSALSGGIEWNLGVSGPEAEAAVEEASESFLRLFYDEQTIPLNQETFKRYEALYEQHRATLPPWAKEHTEEKEQQLMYGSEATSQPLPSVEPASAYTTTLSPRGPQLDALEALETTVEEGYLRALVVMATGLGKTYLAAFFARQYSRILFVAHREEILHQAAASFNEVMPEKRTGIVNGRQKEMDADSVFASVFTLANEKLLHQFDPDAFDLIIVDEFHHAAAASYQRMLDYFEPSFLIGLTATPYRLDGSDVFALCDGNVAFEMDFTEAIRIGALTPFRYYGIYDDTDYSQVTWLGSRYDEDELAAVQLKTSVAEQVYAAWERHRQTRTLAFCSSIRQAVFLADHFRNQGIRAEALHSGADSMDRHDAVQFLQDGRLDIVFTVDLFNEGTDIPKVDTLLFTRPTESLTVFTQQIGRGLRLADKKEHCHVIDLIGNYKNADTKLQALDPTGGSSSPKQVIPTVPDACSVQLDTQVIDMIQEMKRRLQPKKERMLHLYRDLKEELGRRPTYLELYRLRFQGSFTIRPSFPSYPHFLLWAGELNEAERAALEEGEDWIRMVEQTSMSKSYKMVVIQSLLQRGSSHWLDPITPEEAAPFFLDYLTATPYRKQDLQDKSNKDWTTEDLPAVERTLKTMPFPKLGGPTTFDGTTLTIDIQPDDTSADILYDWTEQISRYRLETYFERKYEKK